MTNPPPHAASPEAPLCAAPDPNPRKPRVVMPAHACDTHAHICGPIERYPYSARRVYTPPDALVAAYRHMLDTLGVQRMVLVQPSVYGSDNSVMLNAMAELGERARGVAVVDDDVSDVELERLNDAGVRGVRINVVDVAEDKGVIPMAPLAKLANRIKRFGWHVEFLMHADEFPDLDRVFADFPVDIVLGHLGYMKTAKGLADPGFQGLLRLMKRGKAWVKLTGPYRISTQALPHADTVPFAHALVEAAPERVIWGTDWPHVMVKGAMPNDGDLADLLLEWVPDAGMREQVLVANPAKLYGFSA
ncbi:MAG TPA: amidohydrolase family protein [Burkholderiales bacterium]|jgi:2-pyrone-4,6-dicarboxylate lactonase|nr:amidohydrolase family protein [Burkholderiales bacterium]